MVPDKSRSCSSKFQETPYFIFHGWNQSDLFEFKEAESREEDTENDQENVYEQERDINGYEER